MFVLSFDRTKLKTCARTTPEATTYNVEYASKFTTLSNSLVAITDPIMFKNYNLLNKKIFKKFNFIRWGTDALGYMRCAEGIIDAVIERDIKIWDIAAIIPIIEASGGIITTWDNKTPGINDTIVACNNKKLHKILVNTLQKVTLQYLYN